MDRVITPLTPDTPESVLSNFSLATTAFPDILNFKFGRKKPPKLRFNRYKKRNSVLSGTNWD